MTTATLPYKEPSLTSPKWTTEHPSQEETEFNYYLVTWYEHIKQSNDEELIDRFIKSLHLFTIEQKIRPKNLRLIKFLDQWMAEPDDLGEEFWKAFCNDIEANRFEI